MAGATAQDLITVMVVDDHAVVRFGLRLMLEVDGRFAVSAEVGDGAAALRAADANPPDVVLMDLLMPGMGGVEATRRLKAAHPDVRVVVLTSLVDQQHVLAAVAAGADGFLVKDAAADDVVAAIEAAHRGEAILAPVAARALLDAHTNAVADQPLSPREEEVLALVAEGLANKQIARRLSITERTVKAHLTSIYQALGVADRTQAALWAERRRRGLG